MAVAGVFGLCCGLPVLLSLGVLGAVAGLSMQSWALVTLGIGLVALGWARRARHRQGTDPRGHTPGLRAPQGLTADQTIDISTKGTDS